MANIHNNNFHSLRLTLNMEEYWDFIISKDNDVVDINESLLGQSLYDKCLSSYIDTSDSNCIDGRFLVSKENYIWENSKTESITLNNIGYVGLDNGLISFERDKIDNRKFLEIYQNSSYIVDNDARLKLHQVNGGTHLYEYPITVEDDKIKLNGGFYQGFFKLSDCRYSVLPTELNNGDTWEWEFVLNKTEFEKESNKTLNDTYPNNKGIFFYIGTRAENKWDYLYNKENEDDLLFEDDYVEEDTIGGQKCRMSAFLDMSVEDVPIEWESEAIDDYLNFKYYDDVLYKIDDDGLENYFYEVHKATTIDESQPHQEITCWCKDSQCKKEIVKKTYRLSCCCPSNCRKIETSTEIIEIESECNGYVPKCTPFDLIEDFDEMEDEYDYIEDDIDISDFEYETVDGFKLNESGQWFLDVDNPFLLFDRTCNGYTVDTYRKGDIVRYIRRQNAFKGNLFLLMNRTCTSYTVNTIDDLRDSQEIKYETKKDITNNAFALRITDEGKIGYRYIVQDCESEEYEIKIIEGYSKEGIIKENEWSLINVKVKGYVTTMALEFYVNGKLVFLTKEIPKFRFRKLDDIDEKQEGVPYNISLGGGSQGLCETILPNYMINPYRVYDIEKNFAGSFIGYFKAFRFYTCKMDFFDIINNFRYEFKK